MLVEFMKSTADLRRVQTQMRRREVTLRFESSVVHVTYIGGCYRARIAGSNIVGFGEAPSEANQRLRKLSEMRSLFATKQCDKDADRAEREADRAQRQAAKRSARFDPKRG
jgi:hypothetical protein